jgi:WhiB family transcriptional regulator, redox-sensing transcriptional regulator
MSWHHDAACRGEDPELFFPIGTTGPALVQLMDAKAVCGRCPVQSECLRVGRSERHRARRVGGMVLTNAEPSRIKAAGVDG